LEEYNLNNNLQSKLSENKLYKSGSRTKNMESSQVKQDLENQE